MLSCFSPGEGTALQHRIPVESHRARIGPRIEEMARAVASCVHCGFCLPTCPTYVTLGEEMDSPRGRIVLMKEVLEGNLALEESLPHIDPCLACEACVTACPSGVQYGELIAPFRELAESERRRGWLGRLHRRLLLDTLASPSRFRLLARLGQLLRPVRSLLPGPLRAPLELLPARLAAAEPRRGTYPAQGARRARVGLLAGCAQQVLRPSIHRAAVAVLVRNGVEVVVPQSQVCCGSLALHCGDGDRARRLARANLRAFDAGDYDAVLTSAAGCGSGMKAYGHLFQGTEEAAKAEELASRVRDVSAFLADLEPQPPPLAEPLRATYHDACHLAHAQGERQAPRRLLRAVPNLTLIEAPDWEVCCGSAGIYNLEYPDLAARLGERKAKALLATGAEAVVTGNIGCITQLETHLARAGAPAPVLHTMEILERAYESGANHGPR